MIIKSRDWFEYWLLLMINTQTLTKFWTLNISLSYKNQTRTEISLTKSYNKYMKTLIMFTLKEDSLHIYLRSKSLKTIITYFKILTHFFRNLPICRTLQENMNGKISLY